MTTRIQPVLMSGGAGTRLWPLSRRSRPKQFAALAGPNTLFQDTLLRVGGAVGGLDFLPPIIVGAQGQAQTIRDQLDAGGATGARIVLEPAPRNTAPCAAVAALIAAADAADTLVLLLPCDHAIGDTGAFHAALRRGADAARTGHIVTFGVTPDRPETAYGYIKAGEKSGEAFIVARFAEKPDAAQARIWLDEGGWSWNAGIFLFRADTMILELERHAADILASAREALRTAKGKSGALTLGAEAFAACRAESIDYAVAEKTAAAAVVPVDMGWSDVGLWSAIRTLNDRDDAGNAAIGDVTMVDARDCLAISDGPAVVVADLDGVAVIVQDGMVLVTRADAAETMRRVAGALKTQGRDELL